MTGAPAPDVPEYIVCATAAHDRNGKDHLSLDDGESTVCGLIDRRCGGRADIIPMLFIDNAHRIAYTWRSAYQCKRCARAAPPEMTSKVQRMLSEQGH